MKKSILASLLLTSSFCFANEVVLANEMVNASSPASAIQEKGFLENSLVRNKVELGGLLKIQILSLLQKLERT